MNQTQSTLFNALFKASTVEEILTALTNAAYRQLGYNSDPPVPTLAEIQAFTTGETPDPDFMVFFLSRPEPMHYQVHPGGTRELIHHDSPPALDFEHFDIVADFIKKVPSEPYTEGLFFLVTSTVETCTGGQPQTEAPNGGYYQGMADRASTKG